MAPMKHGSYTIGFNWNPDMMSKIWMVEIHSFVVIFIWFLLSVYFNYWQDPTSIHIHLFIWNFSISKFDPLCFSKTKTALSCSTSPLVNQMYLQPGKILALLTITQTLRLHCIGSSGEYKAAFYGCISRVDLSSCGSSNLGAARFIGCWASY